MTSVDQLASAAATGQTEYVLTLLQNGCDPNGTNRFGRTPIQVMMMGNTSVARLLLLYGANPNLQDVTTGMTPLHDAASGGFLDTVMILDQYHADRNITDNFNRRPVDLAKANGHEDVVDFLEP
nr:PREDICTED: cyclin-dependent kinase 4 inhibitor B-like [Lepisosteus oculatus]